MEAPASRKSNRGVSMADAQVVHPSVRDQAPIAPPITVPLMGNKAASIFRTHDLDCKNFLLSSELLPALGELAALHGLPQQIIHTVVRAESDNRDKRHSLQDFLGLSERLHSLHTEALRNGRIASSAIFMQPPPGSDSSLALRQCFAKYCHLTLGVSRRGISDSSLSMNAIQLNKMCQHIGIAGERAGLLHQASVDIIFTRCKSPGSRRLSYPQWLQALCGLSEETGYDLFDVISSAELNFSKAPPAFQEENDHGNSPAHFQRFSTSFLPRMLEEGFPGPLISSTTVPQRPRPATAAAPTVSPGSAPLKPSKRMSSSAKQIRVIQSASGIPTIRAARVPMNTPDSPTPTDILGFDVVEGMSSDQLPTWMHQICERLQRLETRVGGTSTQQETRVGGTSFQQSMPRSDQSAVGDSIEGKIRSIQMFLSSQATTPSPLSSQGPTHPVQPVVFAPQQMTELMEQAMGQLRSTIAAQAAEIARAAALQAMRSVVDARLDARMAIMEDRQSASGPSTTEQAATMRTAIDQRMDTKLGKLEERISSLDQSAVLAKLQNTMSTIDSTRSSQVESVQMQMQNLKLALETANASHGGAMKELEDELHMMKEHVASSSSNNLSAAMAAAAKPEASGDAASSHAVMAQLDTKLAEVDRQIAAQAKTVAATNDQAKQLAQAHARLTEQLAAQAQEQAQGVDKVKGMDTRLGALAEEMAKLAQGQGQSADKGKMLDSAVSTLSEDFLKLTQSVHEVKAQAAAAARDASTANIAAAEGGSAANGAAAAVSSVEVRLQGVAASAANGAAAASSMELKLQGMQSSVQVLQQQVTSVTAAMSTGSTAVQAMQDLILTTNNELRSQLAAVMVPVTAVKAAEASEGSTEAKQLASADASGAQLAALTSQLAALQAQQQSQTAAVEAVKVDFSKQIAGITAATAAASAAAAAAAPTTAAAAVAAAAGGGGSARLSELDSNVQQLATVLQGMSADVSACATAAEFHELKSLLTTRIERLIEEMDETREAVVKMEVDVGRVSRPFSTMSLDGPSQDAPRDAKFASWDALKHSESTLTKMCMLIRDDIGKLDQTLHEVAERMDNLEQATMESLELKDKIIMRVVRQLDQLEISIEQIQDQQAED